MAIYTKDGDILTNGNALATHEDCCGVEVSDDFNDASIDPKWTISEAGTGTVVESGGSITITSPSGSLNSNNAGFRQLTLGTAPGDFTCTYDIASWAPANGLYTFYIRVPGDGFSALAFNENNDTVVLFWDGSPTTISTYAEPSQVIVKRITNTWTVEWGGSTKATRALNAGVSPSEKIGASIQVFGGSTGTASFAIDEITYVDGDSNPIRVCP